MGASSTTTWDFALREGWPDHELELEVLKDNPALAMMPKDTNFHGTPFQVPVIYGAPTGRSGKFSVAQSRKAGTSGVQFSLTRSKNYAVISIENELAEASESKKGAVLDAMSTEMEKAIETLKSSLGTETFGDGSGKIGTISAISSSVITLTDEADVENFEVGMYVVFASGITAALRDSGTAVRVTAVDRDGTTPQITIASTPTGVTTSDVIFAEGDYESASDKTRAYGFAAWLPSTAPTSGDSFFGVDRSVDPVRLAGVRVSCAGLPLDESLRRLANRIVKQKGSPDYAFISFDRYERLQNLLGSRVEYATAQAYERAEIGFEGIRLRHNKGVMTVLADPSCPSDKCYAISSKYWRAKSLNGLPHILEKDGRVFRVESNADAHEARIGCYWNIYTYSPQRSGVGTSFGS